MGIYNNHLSTAANAGPVWVTGTNYQVGDFVTYNNTAYLCLAAHAAAASFLTDLSADRWRQIGQEQVNYIATNSGDLTVGWTPYADAAGAQPVDGTGGSPTITWGSTPTTPLRGRNSFLLTKTNVNSQGQGVSYSFTIDRADSTGGIGPAVQQISFDYEIASGTYGYGTSSTDSDLTLYIIADPTGTPTVIQPAGYKIDGGRVRATFQPLKTTSSYRLCLHIATTSANPWTMQLDNFSVGPQVRSYGPAMSDWQDYTPTYGGTGTTTTEISQWRRVGDTLHIRGTAVAGTVAASVFTISLPTGLSAKTVATGVVYAGNFTCEYTGAVQAGVMPIWYNSTNISFGLNNSRNGFSALNANVILVNTTRFSWTAQIPVVGWSSNTLVSDSADTRVVAARYTRSTNQTFTNGANTEFVGTTQVFDTHGAYNSSTGRFTAPVPGRYRVSCRIQLDNNVTWTSAAKNMMLYKNGSLYSNLGRSVTSGASVFIDFPAASDTIDLVAGDYISIFIGNNEAFSARNSADANFNYVSIERISGPSQIAASEVVAAKYHGSGNSITIATGNAAIIQFNNKLIDTHGAVTTGASWKFTAPISGIYRVSALVDSLGTAFTFGTTRFIELDLYKQGSLESALNLWPVQVSGTTYASTSGSTLVSLNAGEYIDIRWQNSSGSSVSSAGNSFEQHISVERIGGVM